MWNVVHGEPSCNGTDPSCTCAPTVDMSPRFLRRSTRDTHAADRPAKRRLLAEVQLGRIDVIEVELPGGLKVAYLSQHLQRSPRPTPARSVELNHLLRCEMLTIVQHLV